MPVEGNTTTSSKCLLDQRLHARKRHFIHAVPPLEVFGTVDADLDRAALILPHQHLQRRVDHQRNTRLHQRRASSRASEKHQDHRPHLEAGPPRHRLLVDLREAGYVLRPQGTRQEGSRLPDIAVICTGQNFTI
jgi:hypothetical protein